MAANGAMTTRQIFNLRWNNHTSNMLQVFLEQLTNEKLVDVTLSCEGKFLKVHRIVLSACSPYFQELFSHHKEQNPVIILNGLKFGDLKSVVNFMYCGEIEVAEPEMEGVLAVAEALEVKGLSDVRESYENRHRKSEGSEFEDDGGGTGEANIPGSTVDNKGRSHSSPVNKRRKVSESHKQRLDMASTKDLNKHGTNHVPENHGLLLSASAEEWRQDFPKEIHVKEEAQESDIDVAEGIPVQTNWQWQGETELSPLLKPSTAGDGEEKVYLSKAVGSSDNGAATSEERPHSSHLSPALLGTKRSLRRDNEGVPLTVGGTARKTVASPQAQCKIPRPPNAFMVFANEWRRKLALLHHGETNKDISVRLGAMWKELSPDAKETYFAAARRADEEHKIRYPGYTYNPKEARMRKILRRVAIKHGSSGSLVSSFAQGPGLILKGVTQCTQDLSSAPQRQQGHCSELDRVLHN